LPISIQVYPLFPLALGNLARFAPFHSAQEDWCLCYIALCLCSSFIHYIPTLDLWVEANGAQSASFEFFVCLHQFCRAPFCRALELPPFLWGMKMNLCSHHSIRLHHYIYICEILPAAANISFGRRQFGAVQCKCKTIHE
jgi:hypothetical protein